MFARRKFSKFCQPSDLLLGSDMAVILFREIYMSLVFLYPELCSLTFVQSHHYATISGHWKNLIAMVKASILRKNAKCMTARDSNKAVNIQNCWVMHLILLCNAYKNKTKQTAIA